MKTWYRFSGFLFLFTLGCFSPLLFANGKEIKHSIKQTTFEEQHKLRWVCPKCGAINDDIHDPVCAVCGEIT